MDEVRLEDPVLDTSDAYTRMFLLAEYWKQKYVDLRAAQNKDK